MTTYPEATLTSRLRRFAAPAGVLLLALLIALAIYGPHLFDLSVPVEGDVRAHIFKIDILRHALSRGGWPAWSPYCYDGLPFDPFYPPLFYLLGAGLAFIFGEAVIAYKVLMFFALALNGLSAYFFARRFFKLSRPAAAVCLIAYETSTPLLVNHMYGEGPNLLGWSLGLFFLAIYLDRLAGTPSPKLSQAVLPGLLLGITVLVHPFPVVFAILAMALYYVIWLARCRFQAKILLPSLAYTGAACAIGLAIGVFYWLPALAVFEYASPIYVSTRAAWHGGMPYLLAVILLALFAFLILRRRINDTSRMDFVAACLLLSTVLGMGATRFLPFGLASLLHEFRFATIMAPLFAVLLLASLLAYFPARLTRNLVIVAALGGLALLLGIFAITEAPFVADFLRLAEALSLKSDFPYILSFIWRDFLPFLPTAVPFFVCLLSALSTSPGKTGSRTKWPVPLSVGLSLVLLTSIIPALSTWREVGLDHLFVFVDSYRQPAYAEVLAAVKEGRLVVPNRAGYLIEGDSPVTFGWRWGVETVNGSYNQGDPKFFAGTVHLEWEDRWLGYPAARENLLQENAARFVFIRAGRAQSGDTSGLDVIVDNSYGKLLALDKQVSRAVRVTPILLDVADPQAVTEFFNVLLPDGYKFVFVDARAVPAAEQALFSYALTDDAARLAAYPNQNKILLCEAGEPAMMQDSGVIRLALPYRSVTDSLFYHGDEGDLAGWVDFEGALKAETAQRGLAAAEAARRQMEPLLNILEYTEASYSYTDNRIELASAPGFTLVKDSYFPYWQADSGRVMATTQGFMLVYTQSAQIKLSYRLPVFYPAAAAVTLISFTLAAGWLVVSARARRSRPGP